MLKSETKIQITKLKMLDGIELKSASFLNKEFPTHFHHEWSLALIESGNEQFNLNNFEFQLNSDSLVLMAPFQPHSNRSNLDTYCKYKVIYINEDLAKFIIKKNCINYFDLINTRYEVSYNNYLIQKFKNLQNIINDSCEFQNSLSEIFVFLINENIKCQNNSNLLGNISFQNDMISFLNQNFHKKITLDEMSTIFQIDKFKLMRLFKSLVGLSPQEYLTSLRIENSKKMILENESIVNTALDSGFYDQSHFTNSFKKFVGVSPNEYRNSCNIFQDSSSLIG